MQYTSLLSLLAMTGMGLVGCHQANQTVLEKGGPVTADGYVDLLPPTSYSPRRGVLCVVRTTTRDGRVVGECYDPLGPSVSQTAEHISWHAADTLQGRIDSGRFPEGPVFRTGTGLVIDVEARKCWFGRDGEPKIDAPKHTLALFWNEIAP